MRWRLLCVIFVCKFCNCAYDRDLICVINELNANSDVEFIELKCGKFAGDCQNVPTCSLRGFFIMVVKSYDDETKQPVLLMTINLENETVSTEHSYFVIGDIQLKQSHL